MNPAVDLSYSTETVASREEKVTKSPQGMNAMLKKKFLERMGGSVG